MKKKLNSSFLKSAEAFYLQNIGRFFLELNFHNGNKYIYDMESARQLSLLFSNFNLELGSPGKFYNQEIKGRYDTITPSELFDFCIENNSFTKPSRKEEILEQLRKLEDQKAELLKELGEISYKEMVA